jgi:chemotaxis protein methyltransferase CheR
MEVPSPQPQVSNLPLQLSYSDYLRFRELVMERSGLYFPEKKRVDLESGLLKALTGSALSPLNASHNLDQYYQLLRDRSHPVGRAEMERLINFLTVGETYFFRDEGQFNTLTSHVLPALIARKRAAATAIGPHIQPQLRLWSAGCATGEEAYSLAIILKELLPDIDRWQILILATDINQDSLARAREALYSDWSFRETRAKAGQTRYFNFDLPTKRYALRPDIRQMVTFAPLNLIEDDYPALHNNTVSMDLILCRNVTIYFTEADTRRVVQRFYEALVQEGWLVVGHSEPSPAVYGAFQPRTWPNALLYQKTGQPHGWADNWAWFQPVTIPPLTNSLATPSNKVEPFIPVSTQTEADLLFSQNPGSFVTPLLSPPVPTSASSPPLLEADSCQIAAVLLSRGHISEAVNELQRQLSIDPHLAAAHTLLGRAYANLGRWSEAQRYCQSAIKLDKLQAEAYYLLGLVYEQEAQLESAIAMLKKAIYLEPNMPLPHLNLAVLYKQSGQKKNAERACRNAIKILEKYTPTDIVPHSGGASVQYILVAARRILCELEN